MGSEMCIRDRIGHGGVQYKQEGGFMSSIGGALGLDPTAIQGALEGFATNFGANLDAIMKPFASLGTQLTAVANAFSSMVMTHNFSGELALSVNISNKEAIIEAVRVGIEPSIGDLIKKLIDESANKFKAP